MSYATKTLRKGHTRFVKGIEILLWSGALIALASVFLVSSPKPDAKAFLLQNSDLLALALGEQITDPTFSGVTNSDDAFTIGARAATPDGPTPSEIELLSPTTTIEMSSGTLVFARSNSGKFLLDDREIVLNGNSIITSSDGYRIDGERIGLSLEESALTAQEGVTLSGPDGMITSDSLTITKSKGTAADEGYVLTFEGGVRLSVFGTQKGEK